MSNNDEASGSNDPLPNDNNETNFGNLPDNVLHLIFRGGIDSQNLVAELVDVNQEIQKLQNERQRLIAEDEWHERQEDTLEPKGIMDLRQSIRLAGEWTDTNAYSDIHERIREIRDEYQKQIDKINEDIERKRNIYSLLKQQFLFYMMMLKRYR